MNRSKSMIGTALALLFAIICAGEGLPRQGAPEEYSTLVADRLRGSWVAIDDLTDRLGGSRDILSLRFLPDTEPKIPDKMREAFKGVKVCQTGTVKIVRKQDLVRRPGGLTRFYILSLRKQTLFFNVFGVPAEQNVNFPNSNASIMLVPGKDQRNDLLFVGGYPDRMAPLAVNGPFAAYERVKE